MKTAQIYNKLKNHITKSQKDYDNKALSPEIIKSKEIGISAILLGNESFKKIKIQYIPFKKLSS
jgi:hypothetical protein